MYNQKKDLRRYTVLLILCWMLGKINVYSQPAIIGEVSSQQKESLAYANVLLLSVKDSTLVKGAVATDDGDFAIDQVQAGDYIVAVSMIGYETNYTPILGYDAIEQYELGTIILKRLESQLATVNITGRKLLYEQYVDRLVVNVEKNIVATGGNALEVVSRIPGVRVNELNTSLSVNGNQGVLVMIDGKLNRLPMDALFNLLRSINAETIQKIELYENPPAEYDAEGRGGLIKIITKKNPEIGTNGSYSFNAGYGRRFKYGAAININHRTKRSNIYGSYSFRNNFSESIYSFDRSVMQNTEMIFTDTENLRLDEYFSHNLRVGIDIDISDRTTVGGFFTGFINNSFTEADNQSIFDKNGQVFSIVRNVNKEERRLEHGMLNAYIHHSFNDSEQIEFDVDYLTYANTNPSTYSNEFLDGEEQLVDALEVIMNREAPIENISLKIDYTKQFGEKLKLKGGVKGYRSIFDNNILVEDLINGSFEKNERFSQDYSLEENIAAAYSSLDVQLGDKTNMILGLRYEFTDYLLSTQLDPNFLDLEFDNVFPSLFVAHNFKDRQQLQFSYSKRITRPAFDELAPFVTFIDPNTFFSGNPSLVPGISDNLRLSYRWKNVLLTGTYGFTKDAIFKYQPVVDPSSNTQIYTTLNIDEDHSAGIRVSMPFNITKWWESQNMLDYGWNRLIVNTDSQESQQDIQAFVASSTHVFTLPDQWNVELTGIYQSAAFYGLLRVQPKGAINLGIRKVLPNQWGTLSLSASDLLRTNVWRSTTNVPELNLDNSSTFDVETRIFRITYSATFGSEKIKAARKRTTSSAEQSRRF